jgi:hypothetical protein
MVNFAGAILDPYFIRIKFRLNTQPILIIVIHLALDFKVYFLLSFRLGTKSKMS